MNQEFEAEREAKIKLLEDNLSKKLVTKVFKAWRLAAMKVGIFQGNQGFYCCFQGPEIDVIKVVIL